METGRPGNAGLIRVLLTVPRVALRAGMRTILSAYPDLSIAAELESIQALEDFGETFDVILAAELDPQDLRDLLALKMPVVLVTRRAQDASLLAGAGLSAWGILEDDFSEQALLDALRAVAGGLLAGDPELITPLFALPHSVSGRLEELEEALTVRELDVLQQMAQGMANKQIALELGISEHTVKFHLTSIYAKLGVSSRTEAVNAGIRRGLILL